MNDLHETRVAGLDRDHRVTRFYGRADRSTDEAVRDQLAAAVADFNAAEGDPVQRVAAMQEIRRLRALLGKTT